MTKEKGGRLRFIYGIFLALLTVFVGVLFIVQIWALYRSAPQSPYTPESIAKYYDEISICVFMWAAAFLGSIILAIAYPSTPARLKGRVPTRTVVERTKKRIPADYLPTATAIGKKKKRFRKLVTWFGLFVIVVASAFCLRILCNESHLPLFRSQFFASHNSAPDRLVQCVAISVVVLAFLSLLVGLVEGSWKREQKAYLALIAKSKEEKPVAAIAPVAEPVEEATEALPPAVEIAPVEELTVEEPTVEPSKRWRKFIRMVTGVFFLNEKYTKKELRKEADTAMGLLEAPEEIAEAKAKAKAERIAKKQAKKRAKREEKAAKRAEKKAARALRKQSKAEKGRSPKARAARVWLVRIGLCAVGIIFVVTGVMNGGMKDVLLKAINICTQCIGLG